MDEYDTSRSAPINRKTPPKSPPLLGTSELIQIKEAAAAERTPASHIVDEFRQALAELRKKDEKLKS